jgi:hypothetical protein
MKVSSRQAIALIVLGACSGDPVGIHNAPTASQVRVVKQLDQTDADVIARVLALGLKKHSLRLGVRDAMRASLVTEHKLVFQDFAVTPTGRDLLIEGSRRMGISMDSVDRLVAQLPALDFYLPSTDQRRGWKGEGGRVHVGVAPRERGARFQAFDEDGVGADRIEELKQSSGATFLLQKAQRKSRRIHPQASVPGTAIEDLNDGDLSGSFVEYLPDGSTKVTDLADYFANKEIPAATKVMSLPNVNQVWMKAPTAPSKLILPGDGGGGGGTTGPRDTTFLQVLVVIDVCDDWSCLFGHNEFEWHTYYSANNGATGTWTNRFDLRIEGVPANHERSLNSPALFKKIRYSWEKITTDVVETDSWGDDHFTPSPIWSYGEAGRLKSEGSPRCGYPKYYGGYYDCYDMNLFPWKEVNQNMAWNPY